MGWLSLSLGACDALSLDLDVWQEAKQKTITLQTAKPEFFLFCILNVAWDIFPQIAIDFISLHIGNRSDFISISQINCLR